MTVYYNVILYSIGATAISKLLMDNRIIQELYMSNNNIGDDGITVIAEAATNFEIWELRVTRCGITLIGAKSIATLLSVNNTIRELWLWQNPLTTKGAYLILQSAVNNTACQVDIWIDDQYRSDMVLTIMKILEDRRKMKTNVVGSTV